MGCAAPATRPAPTVELPAATAIPGSVHTAAGPVWTDKADLAPAGAGDPALVNPALATAKAPAVYRARFATTQGDFVLELHRAWAPNAADRFYNLVKIGFYDDSRFFRAVDGFMVQFGLPGDPRVAAAWRAATVPDDPIKHSNVRATISFGKTASPDSATTQVFINYVDNGQLDALRFAAFGEVIQGMTALDALYKNYGESPNQSRIQADGNAYLDEQFPRLDKILRARIEGLGGH